MMNFRLFLLVISAYRENFLLEKQPVKFIPLWKIVKIAFLIILNYLLCSKLVLPSGMVFSIFIHRRALKIASYNSNSKFSNAMGNRI